jgi:hypothetical protein
LAFLMEIREREGRVRRGAAAVTVICCGLARRRFGFDLGLPFVVVKYGGSILWGAMVYLLLAAAGRGGSARVAVLALFVAVAVELSRLLQTPWLDAFRLTTAGALLLGRVFSLWNMLAYGTGICTAFLLDLTVLSRSRRPA